MPTSAIVPHCDVLEDGAPGRLMRDQHVFGEQLVLKGGEEALDDGVVPAVPLATHTARDTLRREDGVVGSVDVLAAAIRGQRPICTSRGERECAVPPSCVAPTSNNMRVRVDDFMKIIANAFLASGLASYAPVRIRSARRSMASFSAEERSAMFRKSRWATTCDEASDMARRERRNGKGATHAAAPSPFLIRSELGI